MKFFILVPDGCGDVQIEKLGNKTPLEAANIENINKLAQVSEIGLVQTVPDGMEPGSDVANIAVLGYDPRTCLTGRAPLEAAAMNIDMKETDIAIRTNLITLDGGENNLIIKDHSAGEIDNADAEVFIKYIDEKLGGDGLKFYAGVSYRCLLVADEINTNFKATPPHDILGKPIKEYLPKGDDRMLNLVLKSYELLKNHPLNIERVKNGKNPANSIWLWGQGKKMSLSSHEEKYDVKGCMVTAVNLLKGIGNCAGLSCPDVPGATGTLHTNYGGKAAAAIEAFKNGKNFAFIHVEAPDECAHCGDLDGKLKSMEYIDQKVLVPVLSYLKDCGEPYRVLILPDHKTPVKLRTHTDEPVPFVLFDSENKIPANEKNAFSETAAANGRFFKSGEQLAAYFFRR